MNKVQELWEALRLRFASADLSNDETLVDIERWIDKHVHESWVIMGSFHISVIRNEKGDGIVILPKNIYSGLMLCLGRVKMDKMEVDRYDGDDAVWLWRNDMLYKCVKPENSHEINISIKAE